MPIKTIFTLILVSIITIISGCTNDESNAVVPEQDKPITKSFISDLGSAANFGTLQFTVNSNKHITGMVTMPDSSHFDVSGEIDNNGIFNLTSSKSINFNGTIDSNNKVSGSWSGSTGGISGAIDGKEVSDSEILSAGYSLVKSCARKDSQSGEVFYCRDSANTDTAIYCPTSANYEPSNNACPTEDEIGTCESGSYIDDQGNNKLIAFNEHYYAPSEFVVINDQNDVPFRFFDMGKAQCRTSFQEMTTPVNGSNGILKVRSCSRQLNGNLLYCRDSQNAGGNVTFVNDAKVDCPIDATNPESTVPSNRVCSLENRVATCLAGSFLEPPNNVLAIHLENDHWYPASKTTFVGNDTFYNLTIGHCPSLSVFVDFTRQPLPAVNTSTIQRECPPYCDTMGEIHKISAEAGTILPPPFISSWD